VNLAIEFSQPNRLWLLAAVAGLLAAYVAVQFTRRKYAVRFTNLDLLDKVAPKGPGLRRHAVAAGFLACIGLQVLAYAGPQRVERVPRERATVMLAIDVSLSMQATDVDPSRIEGAKSAAKTFLEQLPAKFNVGLVSFSRTAVVKVAPTKDHQQVLAAIDTLQLGEGTAIGDAIVASLDAIKTVPADEEGTPPPAVIIVMSDGKTTYGTPDDMATARAAEAGITVSTIAFGTPEGTITLPNERNPVPVPADREALAKIAHDSGGTAYDAESTAELNDVYKDIGSSVGYVEEQRSIVAWFIGFALLAAMLTALGSLAWFGRLP
jgi:Ca-activated chloride channel family protein